MPKLLEIEKEIVREVARGDKHNLRKSELQSTNQCAECITPNFACTIFFSVSIGLSYIIVVELRCSDSVDRVIGIPKKKKPVALVLQLKI